MRTRRWILVLGITLLFLGGHGIAAAGDLDDGISRYTDDGIQKYDDLGEKELNIRYEKMKAKSKASTGGATTGQDGSGNLNSVVVGAGGKVGGDIIIIDESTGPKYNIVGD
jgi:hypothetical protein